MSATILSGADHRPAIVPPTRLGRLLRETREARGESLDDVAARLGEGATAELLTAVEGGSYDLTDRDVAILSDAYGLKTRELVPARSRLVIDLEEGTVSAGEQVRAFATDEPDQVLTRYLSLVYALRGLPPGTPVPLRDLDLAVLGQALRMGAGEVEARLVGLMQDPEQQVGATTRDLRRRLVVPAAGLLVAVTAVGALVLVTRDGERAGADGGAPPVAEQTEPGVDLPPSSIAPAIVLESDAPDEPVERTGEDTGLPAPAEDGTGLIDPATAER